MPTAMYRKHDEREDLLALASDVWASGPCTNHLGNARDAARALVGLVGWVTREVGVIRMQECMASLVRHQGAWQQPYMASLPVRFDGRVDQSLALIAVVTSSLVVCMGPNQIRSAMAFWATENDPVRWQTIAETVAEA